MKKQDGRLKIHIAFPAMQPKEPGWPFADYDYEKRSAEILKELRALVPGAKIDGTVFRSADDATKWLKKNGDKYDGFAAYITTLWPNITGVFINSGKPVVFADELYSGSGTFLNICSQVKREKLAAVGIGSSRLSDFADALKLFGVMMKVRGSKILAVSNRDYSLFNKELVKKTKEIFGISTATITSDRLKKYYEKVPEKDARKIRDRWIRDAAGMTETNPDEVLKSARMHLALKKAMKDAGADCATVDCLGLYYAGKTFAYPCLSFFQLNNDGLAGVCEADIESAVTMLIARHLTQSAGYLSDPVIDTASNQIIYAHCVSTNRVWGPGGAENPYIIRSHAEDRKGASVQSLMPVGETVTTVKVSVEHRAFAVHTARAVANINEERACRTKLACGFEAPDGAETVMNNYHWEYFNWHRVTCYGDFRRDFKRLAALYGLKIIEEDRNIA